MKLRIIVCLFFSTILFPVLAGYQNTFPLKLSMEYITQEKNTNSLLTKLSIQVIKEAPVPSTIKCFDVGPNGQIAIGINMSDSLLSNRHVVCVYDQDMSFQYAISFYSEGDYLLDYTNIDLRIIFLRSGICICLGPSGEINEIIENQRNADYYDKLRKQINVSEKERNGKIYYLERTTKNNFLIKEYYQLVVKEENGFTKIIYEAKSNNAKYVYLAIGIALLLIIILLSVKSFYKNNN